MSIYMERRFIFELPSYYEFDNSSTKSDIEFANSLIIDYSGDQVVYELPYTEQDYSFEVVRTIKQNVLSNRNEIYHLAKPPSSNHLAMASKCSLCGVAPCSKPIRCQNGHYTCSSCTKEVPCCSYLMDQVTPCKKKFTDRSTGYAELFFEKSVPKMTKAMPEPDVDNE